MMDPLRIALVAAGSLPGSGLRNELEEQGGLAVVLVAPTWAAARAAGFGQASVAVVDLDGGAIGADEVLDDPGEAPALVLLGPDRGERIFDLLAQGCSVLPRQASAARIATAARAAAAGLVASEPALLAQALRFGNRSASGHELLEPLTPREHEVLAQLSQGRGNREIAQVLHMSPHTAKFHVAQIIAKLDASSRAHAVAKAMRAGLVAL